MRSIRAVLVSTTILALAVTAGCGSDDKTGSPAPTTTTSSTPTITPSPKPTPHLTGIGKLAPTQILARAKAALKSADSVRVKGQALADGSPMGLDLALTRTAGKSVVSIGAERITIIAIGEVTYIQGNDAFWLSAADDKGQGQALAALFRGKWLKMKTGDKKFGDMSDLAVKDAFVDSLTIPKAYWKTGPSIVDGFNCIGLRDKESVLWIDQATGRPVRAQDFTEGGTLAFTAYNRVPVPQAPPQNLIVDSSVLN